jgi:hypothetical protein
VFTVKTGTATNMNRSNGRCPKGDRLRKGFPHGYPKPTTQVTSLRMTGWLPDGSRPALNVDWLEAYITKALAPELRLGEVVVMDNLSSHKERQ